MRQTYRKRRLIGAGILLLVTIFTVIIHPAFYEAIPSTSAPVANSFEREKLAMLTVKGKAPKTGYERSQFGNGWQRINGCDMRNIILYRDLQNPVTDEQCRVMSGTLNDPYTGEITQFKRGSTSSQLVQIDHVVALSNAWQTGAQQLSIRQRADFANDPLNLLAVDGQANQSKGDGDAATWLPSNKVFRCTYISRQIAVKAKYQLWVTSAERDAIERLLQRC